MPVLHPRPHQGGAAEWGDGGGDHGSKLGRCGDARGWGLRPLSPRPRYDRAGDEQAGWITCMISPHRCEGVGVTIRLKRSYDPRAPADGRSILVERLGSRGRKKSAPKTGAWLKEVAPSTELPRWFAHREALG